MKKYSRIITIFVFLFLIVLFLILSNISENFDRIFAFLFIATFISFLNYISYMLYTTKIYFFSIIFSIIYRIFITFLTINILFWKSNTHLYIFFVLLVFAALVLHIWCRFMFYKNFHNIKFKQIKNWERMSSFWIGFVFIMIIFVFRLLAH